MKKVFTDSTIGRMVDDAEQRLDLMDKHIGKRPSVKNRRIAMRMASEMILLWKLDAPFLAMAKECGKH